MFLETQGSLHIRWEKEGGELPIDRSVDDSHGLLIIRDVKVSDSGIYVCQVSDGVHVGYKNVTLTVGGKMKRIILKKYFKNIVYRVSCNSLGRSFSTKLAGHPRYTNLVLNSSSNDNSNTSL